MGLGQAPFVSLCIHLCHERCLVPPVHARQQVGVVVSRMDEQTLEELPFGQDLADLDGNVRLVGGELGPPLSHVGIADGDARSRLGHRERMIVEHHHRRHHLGDAPDRDWGLAGRRGCRGHPGDRHGTLADDRPRRIPGGARDRTTRIEGHRRLGLERRSLLDHDHHRPEDERGHQQQEKRNPAPRAMPPGTPMCGVTRHGPVTYWSS